MEKNKGWTKKHIEKKRRQLNLKRTKLEKYNIYQRNKQAGAWAMCSTKMWEKRGVAPEGELRVWKHKHSGADVVFIKTKGGFVWYSRYLWEQHYGKIPEGKMVRVKDSNTLNIVIDNLDLIDKAENQKRNVVIRLSKHPEVRRANYLINKITKKTAALCKTIATH